MGRVVPVDHPLVQHKLTLLRRRETATADFRRIAREISLLLAYEVTRNLPLEPMAIETPLEAMEAPILAGKKLCLVSILRAGNGHPGRHARPRALGPRRPYRPLPRPGDAGAGRILPEAARGHREPVRDRGGPDAGARATPRRRRSGGSSRPGCGQISMVCLLAAPEGLAAFHGEHPDVPVFTASVDRGLDEHGYIRPGLGDAGDRLYGTK